jgi:hypothetical protein
MKRFYTLIVLLALAGVMTGCDKSSEASKDTTAPGTNAAAAGAGAAAATTNAPAK